MKVSLNDGETCTVCMNHKTRKETEYYTFMRVGDTLMMRRFEKVKK